MSVTEKFLNNIGGDEGSRRRAVICACVMIALSLAMFFIALFAPFRYYSDRERLRYIYTDTENPEGTQLVMYQTRSVHQSLFKLFAASGALGMAAALNSRAMNEVPDMEEYERARKELAELREEFNSIAASVTELAGVKGFAVNGSEYQELLAEKLSSMNLIKYELLEAAAMSDVENAGVYQAASGAVVVGLVSALLNAFIAATAVVAFALSILALCFKDYKTHDRLFYFLFAALSLTGLIACMFNPSIMPTAAPCALACVSTVMYFMTGFLRNAARKGIADTALNALPAAAATIAVLFLALTPTLTVHILGVGAYPGTVGTTLFARIRAMAGYGLSIPSGGIVAAYVFGIVTALLYAGLCLWTLGRAYKGKRVNTATVACASAASALAIAFTATVTGCGDNSVVYIPGACWYIVAIMPTIALFAFSIMSALFKKTRGKVQVSDESTIETGTERNEA